MRAAATFFAAAMLLVGAALAFTPSEAQKNAVEAIAQVIAGSKKCDDWALNDKMVAKISLLSSLNINDPATFDYVEGRVLFHADRI